MVTPSTSNCATSRPATGHGRRVNARADNGAAAVPGALAALKQAGVTVTAVRVARPSLDDVYLRYAGRRFADAESAEVLV